MSALKKCEVRYKQLGSVQGDSQMLPDARFGWRSGDRAHIYIYTYIYIHVTIT